MSVTGPTEYSDPKNSLTIDVPLESVETCRLLEVCPPGYLPKCVTKQLIYSPSLPTSSGGSSKLSPDTTVVLPSYPIGTRLRFHFKTTKSGTGELIDDTNNGVSPKPMELIIGKGFILEIWEVALNTMKEGEICRFLVPKEMCIRYPVVAQIIRDLTRTKRGSSLTSTSANYFQGTSQSRYENHMKEKCGYQDLENFRTMPQNLTFTFELLEVSLPEEYNISALYTQPLHPEFSSQRPAEHDPDDTVISLERKADKLLVSKDYQGAAMKYAEALLKIDQSQPAMATEDVEVQQRKKVSLLMKSAYCKLNSKDYSESLELLTTVLEMSPDNPMALIRRGKCYVKTASFQQARKDFMRALELDPTYQKAVKPELAFMDAEERKTNPNRT